MACAAYSDNVVKANLHYMYITANNQGRRQKILLILTYKNICTHYNDFTCSGCLQEPAWRRTGCCSTPDPASTTGNINHHSGHPLAKKHVFKAPCSSCDINISPCSTFSSWPQQASWVPPSPRRPRTPTSYLGRAARRPRS